MKIDGNEIKVGNILEIDNKLWRVLKTQHTQPGKGGAYLQVELKEIKDGTKTNLRFRSSESVERAILDEKKFQFLYEDNKKWQSRCLDLDILWWENLNYEDDELTLPHPRFLNRNFVITPLAEVLNRSQKIDKLIDKRWQI